MAPTHNLIAGKVFFTMLTTPSLMTNVIASPQINVADKKHATDIRTINFSWAFIIRFF